MPVMIADSRLDERPVVFKNDLLCLSCEDLAALVQDSNLAPADFSRAAPPPSSSSLSSSAPGKPRIGTRQRVARALRRGAASLSGSIAGAVGLVAGLARRRRTDEYERRLAHNLGPKMAAEVKRRNACLPFREDFVFKNDLPTELRLMEEMAKVRPMLSPIYVPCLKPVPEEAVSEEEGY